MNTEKRKISLHNIFFGLLFFALGYLSFGYIQDARNNASEKDDLGLFWNVWSTVESKYPFTEPSSDEKIYGAIEGLVDSYDDDYTVFFPPSETTFFNETISGNFGGIGAEIGTRTGYLVVVSPLKGSPAEKSGLLPGDIITQVDGTDVAGKTLDGAIALIRGEIGTTVTLTVIRPEEGEESMEITITRDNVTVPTVDTSIEDDVFVISLYNFNQTSHQLFKQALVEFQQSGLEKMLIDLRNNPGGYLESSIDIASYFLEQGKIVLREKSGTSSEDETVYRSRGYDLLDGTSFQILVLINQGSASASEILAGALGEHGVATIVGEQSYGKGSVQELVQMPKNTSIKITVAEWLTPDGNVISEKGISPDYEVEQDLDSQDDVQLEQSLELFDTL